MTIEIKKTPEKAADVPPTGAKNLDPLTNAPGAHPIETGVGAALGGAAAGFAAGLAAGPIGTVVGTVAGAVIGGIAGKEVGEYIDPTADDTWLRDNFASRPYVTRGDAFDHYVPAYRYGGQSEAQHRGKTFEEAEPHLRSGWEATDHSRGMAWDRARHAVKDAYDRSVQLRQQRQGGKK